jgi:hypothetical protein
MPQAHLVPAALRVEWQRSAFCFEALFPSPPSLESEIQLCRTGSFYRDDQGKFKITRAMLEAMAANAQERGVDLPIKYTHEGNTLAAGWVSPKGLAVRPWRGGYGLFGRVKWTEEAAAHIGRGALKYISPEIIWGDKRLADSERGYAGEPIGPSLMAGALVLDPFFNMDPVRFARACGAAKEHPVRVRRYSMLDQGMIDKMKEILGGVGLPEDKLADAVLQLMAALEGGAPAPAEEPMPEEGAAIEAAAQPPELAASVSLLATKVATLEAGQKKREGDEKSTLFASYKAQGKLRYAVEAEARQLLEKSGVDAFKAAYSRVPALTGGSSPKAPGHLPTAVEVATAPAEYAPSPEELRAYSKQHGVGLSKALVALRKAPPAAR